MAGKRAPLTQEQVWRRFDAVEARLTAAVSERMLDLGGVQPGMRILDLASGRGEPALRAARRVGPEGSVLGIDLDDGLLQMARERAEREGLSNAEFRAANAESLDQFPAGRFDAVTIRWGLMYMAAPVAALSQARRVLLPNGVVVAAFWAEPDRVDYFTLPRRLLERFRSLPALDREAPGTFRYADLGLISRDFGRAGLVVDHVEEMEVSVFEAATAAELVDWVRALGMTRLLNDLPEADQQAWEAEFAAEMERRREDGMLRLGGTTRLVRARRV